MEVYKILLLINFLWVSQCLANKVKRIDGDFEFLEENNQISAKGATKKKLYYDPINELCNPLKCKKRELCLLENYFTAVCVAKKDLRGYEIISKDFVKMQWPNKHKKIYENKKRNCKKCSSSTKPSFHCGSDNKTYSSICRIDYYNCIYNSNIEPVCKGFCPCNKKPNSNYQIKEEPKKLHKLNGKHRKYMKYAKIESTNGNNQDESRNGDHVLKMNTTVEVCKPDDLIGIGNRLIDWFSVIMAESNKKKIRYSQNTQMRCKPEVKWMFSHLDLNMDGLLSKDELFDLEHDQNEICIKPFLDKCDIENDSNISPKEWCECFDKTDRPCIAMQRKIVKTSPGVFSPRCDSQGYYNMLQCHHAAGLCWCVDKHGVEYENSRSKGKIDCHKFTRPQQVDNTGTNKSFPSDDEDEDDDANNSNFNFEGSADNEF